MFDRLDQHLAYTRTALNLRSQRQELLASNIANADTPHFKARDMDFKSAFADTLAGRVSGDLGLARTSGRHLGGLEEARNGVALKYRTEYQGAVDGNTVDMNVERSAFAENAMQMEALITFVRGEFQTMNLALQQAQ